jgi:hypothetical protein
MFSGFRNILPRRLMKKLITLATKEIYLEQFDFDAIIGKLVGNEKGVAFLRAYIAIQTATRLSEPLTDNDVEHALVSFCEAEQHVDDPEFEEILEVHKELAELHWMERNTAILKGKLAHKNNEYSFEGGVYAHERAGKAPITSQKREELKSLSANISHLDKQIEEHELKALRESNPLAYENVKVESYVNELQNELDRLEDLSLGSEGKDVVSQLKQKLERLLHKTKPSELEEYQNIVCEFADLMTENPPLIGDCSMLPYPKETILHAIGEIISHCEIEQDATDDPDIRKKREETISAVQNLRNGLVYHWDEIDPEDKDAIRKLDGLASFPDWALSLELKYLDHKKASEEACDAEIQRIKNKIEGKKKLNHLAN